MYNGYTWQSRVLEVRPDRLPPDLDLSLPFQAQAQSIVLASTSSTAPHTLPQPSYTTFIPEQPFLGVNESGSNSLVDRPKTADSSTSPPPPALIHPSSSSYYSGLSGSGVAAFGSTQGKNLFVGNVRLTFFFLYRSTYVKPPHAVIFMIILHSYRSIVNGKISKIFSAWLAPLFALMCPWGQTGVQEVTAPFYLRMRRMQRER